MSAGLDSFLLGVLCMGFLTAALFFYRFWRDTRDRLFLLFGLAFTVMGVNQMLLLQFGDTTEFHPALYGIRLVAFLIILVAILDKNRPSRSS